MTSAVTDDDIINMGELIRRLDTTRATIKEYLDKGLPTEGERRPGQSYRFSLKRVQRWISDFETSRETAKREKDEPQARKLAAEAELAEIKLQREKGALVDINAVADAYKRECGLVRAGLMQIPGSLAQRIAEELDAPESVAAISSIILDEISAALQNLTVDAR